MFGASDFDMTLFGGSILAIVAAIEAGRAGRKVRLLVPEGSFGRGFRSRIKDGRRLPLGFRRFEVAYEGTPVNPPPLDGYAPGPAGHRPFAGLLRRWFEEVLAADLAASSTTMLLTRGRMVRDFIHGTDLSDIDAALDPAERTTVAAQIATNLDDRGLDEFRAGPRAPASLAQASVETVSLASHGRLFHDRFFAPIARKTLPGLWTDVPYELRRKIWMPVFWPGTLLQAVRGEPIEYRPFRPYHQCPDGTMDDFVDALVAEIGRLPSVRVETLPPRAKLGYDASIRVHRFVLADGATVRIDGPFVFAGTLPELADACGLTLDLRPMPVLVAWLALARESLRREPTLAIVAEPDLATHRISFAGRPDDGEVIAVVELAPDFAGDPFDDAIRALRAAGFIGTEARPLPVDRVAAALPAPTRTNQAVQSSAIAAIERAFPDMLLPISLRRFGADNLNEQAMQGIYLGRYGRLAA